MSWSIEEYLIHTIDYFEDYTGFVLILAYDLRIDAYIDYRLGPIEDYTLLKPGILKITRKAKHEMTESSEAHIEFDLERISPNELNPIESAHHQKFLSTHRYKILEAREKENKKLKLCMGRIEKINPYNSPIYEKSFELMVTSDHVEESTMTLLTQDEKYRVGDYVCFLLRTDNEHRRILGLKPRHEVENYLDQKNFEEKNNELNLVEIK